MSGKNMMWIILAVIAVTVGSSAVYYVDEREKAIVFQFGEIVRSNDSPGLHFKAPLINNVKYFDARVQTMDSDPELYLTREKKNLVVDSFVKWRITNAANYYTRLGGLASNARNRLAQRVNDALRSEFGNRSVQQVISGDRVEIMDVVRELTNEETASLGIEVLDVRLKRVDLDPDISERVYQRMEAERSRVAKDLRARGAEAAERIRADADRERAIILAEAEQKAQEVKGQGDALATAIYADAFERDREFYRMYRSLNAYRNTFATPDNLLVIEPDSEFFRYFNQALPESVEPTN
ncbi:MAG TPA: protease modulator HflC [Gammaproteobacteria bacterium]|jgi:membrane protease subunit HflC|nr:MAG: protease modulator HflC [Proteobacteria bacterium TMED51]HAU42731.1 protease modulator HflC [Gammaproteobacteria bacterium]HBP85206.1 protease modulator HflC [Gammaproteobacteria bacterium]|tara:strand:- start:1819 stop:2706 length:888 start_codon:yes stop_codon:yes gene_type:complete